jgi:hypothetical protein
MNMTIRSLMFVAVLAVPLALSAEQTSMSIAGQWTPRDPAKAEALFAVGLIDITRGGLRIEDGGDSLTITRLESGGALARMQQINPLFEAQSIYTLDPSRSTPGAKYFTSRSGSATWDGRQLVIESHAPHAGRRSVYSFANGALEAVTTVTLPSGAANTVMLSYDR